MDLREKLDEAVKARPKGDLASDAGAGAFARYCARIALESLRCRRGSCEYYEDGHCDRCTLLSQLSERSGGHGG